MRVALYGGAFDPIHYGHLDLAQNALKALSLDYVIFMPTWQSPHKPQNRVSCTDRIAMCHLAVEPYPEFVVSTLEVDSHITYTVDTLLALHEQNSSVAWTLLLGEDAFLSLPHWKGFQTICTLAQIAVSRRATGSLQFESTMKRLYASGIHPKLLKEIPPAVSSSQIRDRIAAGQSVSELMPNCVCQYIRTHQLYVSEGKNFEPEC